MPAHRAWDAGLVLDLVGIMARFCRISLVAGADFPLLDLRVRQLDTAAGDDYETEEAEYHGRP